MILEIPCLSEPSNSLGFRVLYPNKLSDITILKSKIISNPTTREEALHNREIAIKIKELTDEFQN